MPKMLQQFFWLLWLQPNTIQITILYAAATARSPDVKMSESKVQLQMVNVKYNYFPLTRPILVISSSEVNFTNLDSKDAKNH